MFYKGVRLEVDKNENIYVLDRGNFRIQVYDKKGKYNKTVGRKGQGPGEFQQPYSLFLDSYGNIYVNDGYRISIFNDKGNFKRSIPFEIKMNFWAVAKNGNISAQTFPVTPKDRSADVPLFNSRGKKIKTIINYPYPIDGLVKGAIVGEFNSFRPRLYFSYASANLLVYGHSSKYRLFIFNSKGEIVLIIEKSENPQIITKKDKNKEIENEIALIKEIQKVVILGF